MLVSLASIGVNLLAVILLLRYTRLGHAGLALSTSLVAMFGCLVLIWLLRRRIGGIYGRSLAASFLRIGLASAVMGIAVSYVNEWVGLWLETGQLARLMQLGVSVPAGAAIFYGLCRAIRVPELELATSALRGAAGRARPSGGRVTIR
jgi:putative peptidoglycan lipid II flippase